MENIRVALSAIRSQKLRTALTVLIIAVGISALVGILTATDSIRSAINSEFTMMGANTFSLRNRDTAIRAGKAGKKPKVYRPITYREAQQFTEEFLYPAQVSISTQVSWAATIKHGSNKTNPNCMVIGSDQQYLATAGYELSAGRNITNREVEDNAHVVLIGAEVA
ncbi:MAG: ABC transporter permease, partial [Bacteroidota bacterium]